MTAKEIVTLQIGHYANHVGTHWWNLQEASFSYDPNRPSEANHDILFKEGCTLMGIPTYLPRLVCIDLKGGLGSMKQCGNLYDINLKQNHPLWSGPVDIQKTEPSLKNEFILSLERQEQNLLSDFIAGDAEKDICQASNSMEEAISNPLVNHNLDSGVKVWSDYLSMHMHPRSIHLITEYSHQNEVEPFNIYYYGQQVMSVENQFEDIIGRIHYFVEECDNLQGFQLIIDGDNGFSGVGESICSYLNDEFGNKSLLTIPVFDVSTEKEKNTRLRQTALLNSFICLEKMSTFSDMMLPLSCRSSLSQLSTPVRNFPLLSYEAGLAYHTSAILAASLDTVTMAYRSKQAKMDFQEFTLTLHGRKVAALSSVFPIPLYKDASLVETFLNKDPATVPQSLTPGCTVVHNNSLTQNMVVRGLPINMKINIEKFAKQAGMPTNVTHFNELLQWYFNEECPSKFSFMHNFAEPCRTTVPFPQIFNAMVSANGLVNPENKLQNAVDSVSIIAGIHNSDNIKDMLTSFQREVNSLNIKKFDAFVDAGLEKDEFIQIVETFTELVECYGN